MLNTSSHKGEIITRLSDWSAEDETHQEFIRGLTMYGATILYTLE
jgi:hypothetical protein